MKQLLRKILPKSVWNLRHLYYAWRGAQKYGHPSEEIFVIGITGTSGKSSTISFIRQLLESAGLRVGSLSTVDFYIAGEDKLNDQKMTMLGKMQIQKYLREMVDKKCDVAIVETTSEGRVQHRHRFINYDMMLLTNFYPEHIDSHGSFEKYKQAKLDIFSYVAGLKRKKAAVLNKRILKHVQDDAGMVPKVSIINGDIDEAKEFLSYKFDTQHTFGKEDRRKDMFLLKNREMRKEGLQFEVKGHRFAAPVQGEYNMMNILLAISTCRAMGLEWKQLQGGVSKLEGVPGRIEFIAEAKEHGFNAIVDYAFEPVAIKALYKVVRLFKPERIIHVLGSTGGGRDIARRFSVGEYVGKKADICIITDEDPYDDDPMEIINDVASAALKMGKKEGEALFKILDRAKAIQKAVDLAGPNDMLLVTGKGSEQAMVVKGELIPWDDRTAIRKALKNKKDA